MLTEYKSLRQSVLSALAEITNNLKLGKDYSLEQELADAIALAYNARKHGYKAGDMVSPYARQGNLFQLDDGATAGDFNNATMLMLADVLNDNRVTRLKNVIRTYNAMAADAAAGQVDLWSGGVKSKEDIINEVNNIINNGKEENIEQKQKDSVQQDGAAGTSSEGKPEVKPEETMPSGETLGTEPVAAAIAAAEAVTDANPTDAQKEAGNYKKGHVKVDGFDITIENAKGSTRSGKDADGKEWSVTMNNTYGYIRGTEGVDGDHIDIYLSDDPSNGNVFVIDQVKADGTFDEHKVMYGFASAEEARDNYIANYSEGWTGLGTISEVTKDEFKKWIESSHRKTKPFADYKNVKVEGAQNEAADGVVTPAAEKTDNQGNPLNEDGTLKLEKLSSIDEITDEDFSTPTRSVELPTLPKNVDEAIGANGKPVIIKKNIFERNAERHSDLTPDNSREILEAALYTPDLYGQNQKAKRPYNWVVINIKDKEGKNRLVLIELSPVKENAEIVHWHYIDDKGLEKIKRQAEREDGQLLILPSESEEAGALSSPTSDLSSDGKVTNNSSLDQEKSEKSRRKKAKPTGEKIEDVGEKLAGARNYAIYKALLDPNKEPMSFEDFADTPQALSGFPYPTAKEVEAFGDLMRNIFETVKEREEDDKVALFQVGNIDADNSTPAQQAATNAVLEALNRIPGLEVVMETEEAGQAAAGMGGENNLQKDAEFMRVWHGSAAVFDHFDGAFMLTGEGAMVYGAGHYVTNVKGTGRMYAEELIFVNF